MSKDELPLLGAGLLVVFAIMYAMHGKGGSSTQSSISYTAVPADQGVLAQQTAMEQARIGGTVSILQSFFGLEAAQAGDLASVTNTRTQADASEANTATQASAATQIANYQSQAAVSAAQIQGDTAAKISSDQLSAAQGAQHVAQQKNFWGGLFGAITSIGSAFGI